MHLLFFDIDGTLAIGKDVPDSAAHALNQARSQGDLVFICTGRSWRYVMDNFAQYCDGIISSNGRMAVLKDGTRIYDHPMKEAEIKDAVERLDRIHAGYAFFEDTCGYYGGPQEGYAEMTSVWDPGFLKEGIPETMKPYNFDVWLPENCSWDEMAEALGDGYLINPHTPHPSADITIRGIDKGSALKAVTEYLKVPMENTYAFGDGRNDVCMFREAGHTAAMGNGMPETKQAAEFVTSDIKDDGIARAMRHFGLV